MNKNVYFVDFDTGARHKSHVQRLHFQSITELEDFIQDAGVVSKLRQSRINTMENLADFYSRQSQWFMNRRIWTDYEFGEITGAVRRFRYT